MEESWLQGKISSQRIRLLILYRLLVVTLLLGSSLIIEFKLGAGGEGSFDFSSKKFSALVGIMLATYLLSAVYLCLFHFTQETKVNIHFQAGGDILIASILVHFTGGIESEYSLFYILIIIYSVMYLAKRGGMLIASACSIAYGLLFVGEIYFSYPPHSLPMLHHHKYTAAFLTMRFLVHLLSFYLIALVASYLVERERKMSSLLEEKESAFEQLDLLHRSIIESVEAGIITVSLTGKIKLFNRAASEITGLSRKEVINRKIELVFPDYQNFRNGLAGRFRSERQLRGELEFQKKDGSRLILGISVSALRNSRGLKIGEILIFQNLSEVKKMEEALEKNRWLAVVGEMAAGLAHEIRNPLAAISGSIQLLKKSYYPTKREEKLMEIILRAKEQIEGFMKDFLLLARTTPHRDEMVDINELVGEVLETLRLSPDWPQTCEVELNLVPGVEFMAKQREIRQLLWNLILNALQAMPEGGQLRITSSIIDVKEGGSFWELKVQDTGVGIAEDKRDLIFQPFYTTKERGTGLGLAIVNNIVAGFGGMINLESHPGQGTTFVVVLPMVKPEAGVVSPGEGVHHG